MDRTAMNNTDVEWERSKGRRSIKIYKSDSSHPDFDKDKNQQTVTRIFHGLYAVTTTTAA